MIRNDLQIIHPFEGGFNITPSDNNNLPKKTRGIYVSVAGNLAVIMADGSEVTWPVAAGVSHPLQVIRVKATGTTATGIIGGV